MFGLTSVAPWLMALSAWAAPGDHIRVGDVELVPEVDLGAELRTNVYRDETTSVSAADFRIAPGLAASASGDDHEFRANGKWILRKYFYVGDDQLDLAVPTSERIGNLDRFDEFNISAGMDTFRRNIVGFKLADDIALQNFTADAEYADVPYSSQLRNTLTGGLRTNPGQALEVTPGGAWTLDSFRVPSADGLERNLNTRNTFGPTLVAKWAFLPRTSIVANASWMVIDWQENALTAVDSQEYGGEIALPNSNHVKVTAGIDGRFTEKLFAQLELGYGVALYNEKSVATVADSATASAADATGLDGLLVKSQLRYSITPTDEGRPGSSVAVGFLRDFRPSFFTNYVQVNQLFADYHGRFGIVMPALRYELRFEDYNGEIARNDIVNRVTGDLTIAARDWASVTAGGWWQQRASSVDTVEYDDVNFHLLATFTY